MSFNTMIDAPWSCGSRWPRIPEFAVWVNLWEKSHFKNVIWNISGSMKHG